MDIIFIIKTIIIGIVEGLTEFIPVSSTGHMILVGQLINFSGEFAKMFEVVCQLAAIMAVVVLFWKKIYTSVIQFFRYIWFKVIEFIGNVAEGNFKEGRHKKRIIISEEDKTGFRFGINVIVGSIPMMIVGLTCYKKIKKLFNPNSVVIGLIVGGILLLVVETIYKNKKDRTDDIDQIKPVQALIVGCFQVLAVWPGMSRSSSTIVGGWVGGLATSVCAEFSFFLAIPAMIGSSGLDLLKFDYSIMNSTYWVALILGCIVSFVVSLVVIKKFIDYLKKKPMRVFAIYRIAIGVVLAVLAFANIIILTMD